MSDTNSATDEFLGRRLRALREDRGLSVCDFSEALQLSPTELRRAEAGELRLNGAFIAKAAALLDADVLTFFELGACEQREANDRCDDLRRACIEELMVLSEPSVFKLVLSLLWIMREEGTAGAEALSAFVKQRRSATN